MEPTHSQRQPTMIGFSAVLMWATLALLTDLSGTVPPFQLTAMAFTVAFGLGGLAWVRAGGTMLRHLRLPWPVWGLGVAGLFG
ncbi:MAG: EamA family transporter, partial [Cyanobacteria bacterium J06638_6]